MWLLKNKPATASPKLLQPYSFLTDSAMKEGNYIKCVHICSFGVLDFFLSFPVLSHMGRKVILNPLSVAFTFTSACFASKGGHSASKIQRTNRERT